MVINAKSKFYQKLSYSCRHWLIIKEKIDLKILLPRACDGSLSCKVLEMCVSIVLVIFYLKNGQKKFFFHFFETFTLVASIITKIVSFLTKTKTIMVNFIKMLRKSANLALKMHFLEIIWSCLRDEIL
jgi:hypothetical protein